VGRLGYSADVVESTVKLRGSQKLELASEAALHGAGVGDGERDGHSWAETRYELWAPDWFAEWINTAADVSQALV
jgi:hypothetical protein